MFMKNAIPYRLPRPWDISAEKLEEQLLRGRFAPLGSHDIQTSGWAERDGVLVTVVSGRYLLRLQTEKKLLPSKVIKKQVVALSALYEEEHGYPPGRKALRELKERALQELLPKAQSVDDVTLAWIDPKEGYLFVDASSPAKGDAVVEHLRKCLDEFPLKPLHTQVSPSSFMCDVLTAGEVPDFSIDREVELRSVGEEKATVRYSRHPLVDEIHDEIKGHLAAGKLPTKLAMTYADRMSFVLTERMIIKSITVLDILKEAAKEEAGDAEMFEVDFTLFTCEFIRAFNALVSAMGGEIVED